MKKKKIIVFQADVTKFDKKGIAHFLFAILVYVHDDVLKRQLMTSLC